MKTHFFGAASAGAFMLAVSMSANSALIDRGGGLIYDTDLNITWLADANYAMTSGYDADGLMTWSEAMTWASNLSYGGYTDWRLTTAPQPDASCSFQSNNYYYCTGSEMGHLFYTELGGTAFSSISTSTDPDLSLFTNIQSYLYWSSTDYALFTNNAWRFNFAFGHQNAANKDFNADYAWAVRDGDVAAVPVPAAAWLFGSGLLGLIGMAHRKAA